MYYACSYPLEPGSVVEPANWTRILRRHSVQQGNPWLLVRELVFENIRKEEFPDKPSRFDAAFVLESIDDLKRFIETNNRTFDLKYKVELVHPDKDSHKGCCVVQDIGSTDSITSFEEKARKYWSGNEIQLPEVVTLSSLKIVQRIGE